MTKFDHSTDYWDEFYNETAQSNSKKLVPSQFAAFVLNEFPDKTRFVDFGCGNGRDSFFFADHGKQVMGVDGSLIAVEQSNKMARRGKYTNLAFNQLDLSQKNACMNFISEHKNTWSDSIFYARFFLHAITESSEQNLLHICREIVGDSGKICLEFRTRKDEYQLKETASHYRRFIDPFVLIGKLNQIGLKTSFFCEGYGYAKYKNDDAHVARLIAGKT